MNRFSIRDIENLTGIKAHTLRIWEQRYGIIQPKRTDTNIRYYDGDDLKNALRVSLLNSRGYKISVINGMSEDEMNELITEISDHDFRLKATVNELLECTVAVDSERFEDVLDGYIARYGMEKTIEQLLFAFLEKIGLMWMTDKIFPAQEHIASNIITRKLALATDSIRKTGKAGKKTVLLFLPEGEIHDIGLLYIQYLVLRHRHKAIYLGQSTPLAEAAFIYELKKPEYIYIHITSTADNFDAGAYIKSLHKTFAKSTVFLSGSMLAKSAVKPWKNVKLLHTLEEVKRSIESI
jgi:DNA-binding transcriptional MerR regulator